MVIYAQEYVGGVWTGTACRRYFRVQGGPGEVEIAAELEGGKETASFPVEEGKLYRLSVMLKRSSATLVTEQNLLIRSPASLSPPVQVEIVSDIRGAHFLPFYLQGMDVEEYERPTPTPTPGPADVARLIGKLADPDRDVRRAAALDLGYIGSPARDAVPALVQMLRTDPIGSVREAAAGALVEIDPGGPDVVPTLIEALGVGWSGLSIAAADALGVVGPEARDAVPALVKMMLDARSVPTHEAAADALGNIGPDARDAVPALVDSLGADDAYGPVRSDAEALGKIGPEAREAVASLVEALDDQRSTVRAAVAVALGQITGQNFGEDAAAWRRWNEEHRLPQYTVVLHNDDVHSFAEVIAALKGSVSSIDTDEAEAIGLETHNTGSAVLAVCPLKQAEFYRDRIRSFGLDVTVERQ